MKLRVLFYITSVLLSAYLIASCNDDDEMASIVGKWQINKAEYSLSPTPFKQTKDNINATLEFKSDNTANLVFGNETVSGTYEVNKETLVISNASMAIEQIELSGSYKINELSQNNLILETKRDMTIEDPTLGSVSGKVKVVLYFDKVNQ